MALYTNVDGIAKDLAPGSGGGVDLSAFLPLDMGQTFAYDNGLYLLTILVHDDNMSIAYYSMCCLFRFTQFTGDKVIFSSGSGHVIMTGQSNTCYIHCDNYGLSLITAYRQKLSD